MSASSRARCSPRRVPQSARSLPWRSSDATGSNGSGAREPRRCPRRPRSARRRRRGSSRASPAGSALRRWRRTSRLLATSRSSVSMPAPVIVSAASTVAPPANTAKRAKHACSSSPSRLVAPVDRRAQRLVAGGRVARPGAESVERAVAGVSAISAGESSPQRAAASSIASGSPSTRRQISAIALALLAVQLEVGIVRSRALAEQRDGVHVGDCRESGARAPAARAAARGSSCSACTASGSRLVASTVTLGHAAGRPPMNAAAPGRCSQLSTTSSRCLAARKRSTACSADSPASGMIAERARRSPRERPAVAAPPRATRSARRRRSRPRRRARPRARAVSCRHRRARSA